MATAGRALRVTVLSDLYVRLGTAPETVDLPDLWRRLGVHRSSGQIAYDDSAPLAGVRRAIAAASRALNADGRSLLRVPVTQPLASR